jgi:maltose alpha-D-glucosyltransferase / alpha-amylase
MSSPELDVDWRRAAQGGGGIDVALASWLPSRRWFGAKDRDQPAVVVDDAFWLSDDVVLLIVRAEHGDGPADRYAVPLALVPSWANGRLAAVPGGAIVATVDEGAVVDAMVDGRAAQVVISAALTDRRWAGMRSVASGHARRPGVTELSASSVAVRILGAEQSNSSVILGERVIGKLVRRVVDGDSPDVTVPEHLAAVGFANAPGLVGTLDVADGERICTVVVVHDAVANEGDLWSIAEELLAAEAAGDPDGDPAVFDEIVALLGRRVAELHLALAVSRPGFEPEPVSAASWSDLVARLADEVASTRRALERARSTLPADAAAPARRLVEAGDDLVRGFMSWDASEQGASSIRVHGDLHLGQVLWTDDDVVFIDFEGEPARSMLERAAKQSPLADVAGVVRSLDYAVTAAVGAASGVDPAQLRTWATARVAALQETFWSTYCAGLRRGSASARAALLPDDDAAARGWLDLHVAIKALYEVRYELANRPSWVTGPLAAVAAMLSPVD